MFYINFIWESYYAETNMWLPSNSSCFQNELNVVTLLKLSSEFISHVLQMEDRRILEKNFNIKPQQMTKENRLRTQVKANSNNSLHC
jgi:hypothetical protein